MNSELLQQVQTQKLDHHGLVAAIGKILKIEDKINARIPIQHRSENITRGQSVMAMVINGLGFTEHRLYMVQRFFNDIPTERLLGQNVTPELLNDDNLGRTLDAIHQYGVTKLFSEIAFEIALEHRALGVFANLDTTSISVEGQYEIPGEDVERGGNFTITHGYSKDQRSDLKQLVLSLTTTGPSSFPVWIEALSGNSSDKSNLVKTVESAKKFQEQLKNSESFVWVADSALYNKNKLLSHAHNILWVTRVPETIADAKALVQQDKENIQWTEINDSYSMMPIESNYGGVRQRWILIHSKKAFANEVHTVQEMILKKEETLQNAIKKFEDEFFYCEKDAHKDLQKFIKGHPLFIIEGEVVPFYEKKGTKRKKDKSVENIESNENNGEDLHPYQNQNQNQIGYSVKVSYSKNLSEIKKHENARGRFILATNDFDLERLPDHLVLKEYKEQSKTERSFKFLKDPSFFCSEVYLKKSERVQALMFIMSLCLMIHNVGQFHIRKVLKERNQSFPNQVNKLVQNPSLKWIFQCFRNVGVVKIKKNKKKNGGLDQSEVAKNAETSARESSEVSNFSDQSEVSFVTNVDELRMQIIRYFGQSAMEIYGVNTDREYPANQLPCEQIYLC
jgi:transposase